MNISNKYPVMIFRNEENGKVKYQVSIGNKKQDGSYENASFPIQFNKGVELANQTKIKINNAWLSFYKWEYQDKKGTTFFIKCNDFEEVNEYSDLHTKTKIKSDIDVYEEFGNSVEINDDDLPF